jgi:aldose 1-epimerase
MSRVVLEGDRLRLEINPALGAGIADFSIRRNGGDWPLMRRAEPTCPGFNALACYLLAPWSNRIAGARFRWRGREHPLRPDWPDGSAIHGLVKDRPWRITERSPCTATLSVSSDEFPPAFPWRFRADVRYAIWGDTLSVRLSVGHAATAGEPMPAGLGFHPFFPRALWDPADEVSIRYAASGRYPASGMIPTGRARPDDVTSGLATGAPLPGPGLDDVFLGSPDGAQITWPASGLRLTYSCSASLTHAVLYTGLPDAFCFEPVTMVNDGFNLAERGWPDTGVVAVAPGDSLRADWSLRVDTL